MCLSTTSAKLVPVRSASRRHRKPCNEKLCLESLVEALKGTVKRLGDGFSDHRSHQGVEDASHRNWIFTDRCLGRALKGWRQNFGELFVSGSGESEGVGQDGADSFRELTRIVKLLLQLGDRSSILLENHTAQRFQFGIPFDPRERCR